MPRRRSLRFFIVLLIVLVIIGTSIYYDYKSFEKEYLSRINDGFFTAHFIDVGQGDATLLVSPDNDYMLIDTGTPSSADYLVKYLKDLGVDEIQYLVITHPHDDHYGGSNKVIENFDIENFVVHKDMFGVYPYDKLINKLESDCEVIGVETGDEFIFDELVEISVVLPTKIDPDDYNNCSLGIVAEYGRTKFIFTGDAEKKQENALVKSDYDIDADVLSVGHHGSSTSSTKNFIEKVSPEYAVISCGENNRYNHPNTKTLETLSAYGVTILRTDLLSDIVITSNGTDVEYIDDEKRQEYKNKQNTSGKKDNLFLIYVRTKLDRVSYFLSR